VAKYLYQKHKINIHAENKYAFRWTWENGHLVISKWLYILGNKIGSPIDIHADNEFAFRSCYSEIVHWLHSL